MSSRRPTTIAVLFGGRSVEHDVSIVTGQQVIDALPKDRYEVVPIYISRDGKWYTGDPLLKLDNFKNADIVNQDGVVSCVLSPDIRHHGLILNPLAGRFSKSEIKRLDVVFPAVHGSHGEDGTLQGLFELADIPYVGCATMGSALTNDKILTKMVLRQSDVPVLDDIFVSRDDWLTNPDEIIVQITSKFEYPLFIKPATLGSSIGVGRADSELLLRASIDIAANFDRRIIVEPAMTNGIEINCSVMGYGNQFEASVLEQPITWDDFLSFEDKYLSGGEAMKSAERIIPAPISDKLTQDIKDMTISAFRAVDGRGIARIDYLVKPETNEVYLNEINTMPGSVSFYLWREDGYSTTAVVERLIKLAQDANAVKRRNMYDYKTNLVAVASQRGTKGAKGTKS
jgi:D-alanine-D-alanine ligase